MNGKKQIFFPDNEESGGSEVLSSVVGSQAFTKDLLEMEYLRTSTENVSFKSVNLPHPDKKNNKNAGTVPIKAGKVHMTVFLCQQTFLNNMTELMDILLQGLSYKWLIKPCLHSRVLLLVKFIAPDTSFKQ